MKSRHHFNLYIDAPDPSISREEIAACERAIAGIINAAMKAGGEPPVNAEAVFVETFEEQA